MTLEDRKIRGEKIMQRRNELAELHPEWNELKLRVIAVEQLKAENQITD